MSKQLGSFKVTRASGDASMLTELRRRATQSLDYNQKITNVSKPVFSYSVPTLFAGPPALFTIARIDNPQFTSFEEGGTTPTPTYQITESVSSVEEGAAVVFTVTTTNVPDGTTLYWENIGTTTANDFSDNQNDGTITITSNSGSITRTLLLDDVPAETETIILQLRTESLSGSIVATSGTVSVVDKTVVYAVSEDTTSVDEGSSVTFTITTTNVPDGTTLYWVTTGTAAAADFTDNVVSGSFTITSGSGTVVRSIVADVTTEGPQTFTLAVRTGSIAGPTVATSSEITINDTSTAVLYTWTEQTGAPAVQYRKLTVASDFMNQIATSLSSISGQQGPYISTNEGATWTRKDNGMTFLTNGASYTNDVTVARSTSTIMYCANRRLFAGTLSSTFDKIYKSTDTGDNWTATGAPDSTWSSITCSADGTIVLAGNSNSSDNAFDRKWAISTNGGTTWTAGPTIGQWRDVAMSSDGTRMYAVNESGSLLYRSSDTGTTWSTTSTTSAVRAVACSSDGLVVLIGRGSSTPMISTNGGVTLTAVSSLPTLTWDHVAVSDDGTRMAAIASGTASIYLSTDTGATWSQQVTAPSQTWGSIAANTTGSKFIAGPGTSAKPYVGVAP